MSEGAPVDWRSVTLASLVAGVTSGGTPASGNPRYYQQTGLPFVKIDDMTRSAGRYVDSTTLHITSIALKESATRRLPAGTILISMYGTIGLTKVLDRPMASNQAISALVPPFDCNADYLYHAICFLRPRLERLASQTTQPNISGKIVKKLTIEIPRDHREQRKIAEMLDTADESIRSTENLLAKLKLIKLGLLRQLLNPADVQCWEHGIVATWGEVTLGRQRSPGTENGPWMTPYLRVANVFDARIDFADVLAMNFSPAERRRFSLREGDLLLNEGQSLELVGRCAKFDGPDDVYCFQNTLVRYRCKDRVLPDFAYLVFSWWREVGRFMQVAKQTTSIAHLGVGRFAKMQMAIPPINTQRRICDVWTAHNTQIEANKAELTKLRKIKQGLMGDLLTGQVRVTVD